jgi:hypothetical protein
MPSELYYYFCIDLFLFSSIVLLQFVISFSSFFSTNSLADAVESDHPRYKNHEMHFKNLKTIAAISWFSWYVYCSF